MAKRLIFSKDFWSSTYQIKDGTQVLVRTEKASFWSYDSTVKTGDNEFFFDVKGLFANSILVYDKSTNQLIAKIDISSWQNKAKIEIDKKGFFEFEKTSFLSGEWQLSDDKNVLIHFKQNWFSEGKVDVYYDDKLLLSIGIFLISLFQQKNESNA